MCEVANERLTVARNGEREKTSIRTHFFNSKRSGKCDLWFEQQNPRLTVKVI
jgi:hypothetical protein